MRIDLLSSAEAPQVVALLREIDPSLFDGLPLETDQLRATIASARRDRYWGVWDGSALQAVFFLRGLDAGFAAPAFGVAVASFAQRRGLGHLTLVFAETWSRAVGVKEMMLSVGAGNEPAMALYKRHGFSRTEERSPKGNVIYRKALRP